jgi:spore maturation protein CgeB
MNISFFGSSLVSAYWNGAATYYRGLIRALAQRGDQITFYESDAYERQKHRDIPDPDWAAIVIYSSHNNDEVRRCLDEAQSSDLIIKCSGVGVFDDLLEAAVLELKSLSNLIAFLDVDAPCTLDRMAGDTSDYFRALVPRYDLILTYGGGEPVVRAYKSFGAKQCVPIYNALDPSTHHPVASDPRFEADLGLLANRLPDREARIDEFFLKAAAALPDRKFLLGGNGWSDKQMPPNVKAVGHVYTKDHNAFNCTPLCVLNVNRDSMAKYGFSPATRVFEAAGAGACLITDAFLGVETFFEPDKEILVAEDGADVAEHVMSLTPERAKEIGQAALKRVLAEHTYAHRAALMEQVLNNTTSTSKSSNLTLQTS